MITFLVLFLAAWLLTKRFFASIVLAVLGLWLYLVFAAMVSYSAKPEVHSVPQTYNL